MKIHEYQARRILQSFDVPLPKGEPAASPEEALKAASSIGGRAWAVKAQVHAGGRGKAGGVKLARSLDDVSEITRSMIGSRLVTAQTGAQGAAVDKVLIQEGLEIAREFYVGFLIDRKVQKPVLITSTEGGMEIEKVADGNPEKIIRTYISPDCGLTDEEARSVARRLEVGPGLQRAFADVLKKLWKAFWDSDCSLLEINPLVITAGARVLPLDAKITIDDSALFRHPEFNDYTDPAQEDPTELSAKRAGLQYIHLGGNIACLVNGAGLAMATMDAIKLFGGEPANFLDIGGGATPEKVTAAFEIMLADPDVRVILVNIFGGIMKCDTIAQGITEACRNVRLTVPLVVRMKGTNEEIGKEILRCSGLPIISADTLGEAAGIAVRRAKGGQA